MLSYIVPSKPTNLNVRPLSHDLIKITWEPVDNAGDAQVTGYVLEVNKMGNTRYPKISYRELTGDLMETTESGLEESTDYQ